MNWRGHVLFALLLTFVSALACQTLHLSTLWEYLWAIPIIVFGALFPDIDIETSKAQRIVNFLVIVVALAYSFTTPAAFLNGGWRFALEILGAYFIVVYIFKPSHRGITHTLFSAFVFSAFVYLVFNLSYACYGLIAYISHLIADSHLRFLPKIRRK